MLQNGKFKKDDKASLLRLQIRNRIMLMTERLVCMKLVDKLAGRSSQIPANLSDLISHIECEGTDNAK